jgi:hypothetical protein
MLLFVHFRINNKITIIRSNESNPTLLVPLVNTDFRINNEICDVAGTKEHVLLYTTCVIC